MPSTSAWRNGVVRAGDTWQNPANIPFPVGVWTHFAVVKSGSGAFLYTNGVLVASIGSGVVNPAATEFRIGRQYGGFGEYWAGRIDDVRVWTTARTESDIRRTMTVPLDRQRTGLARLLPLRRTLGNHRLRFRAEHQHPGWAAGRLLEERCELDGQQRHQWRSRHPSLHRGRRHRDAHLPHGSRRGWSPGEHEPHLHLRLPAASTAP
jgi:hypothetical protein